MRPSEYIEAEALIKEMDGRIEFRTKLLAMSDEVMRAKHQGAIPGIRDDQEKHQRTANVREERTWMMEF